MSWVKIIPPPAPPHYCERPGPSARREYGAGVGSEWQCEDCKAVWELTNDDGAGRWEVRSICEMARKVRECTR